MTSYANRPKVSIIIPVYNGANYLNRSIDCALAQTYENTEVIVVNDGSTDGGATDAIARSYGDRINYIVKKNGGVSSALNLGIERMSGEYFSWLSHDDEYAPTKVADSIAALQSVGRQDDRTIAYTGHYHIDVESKQLRVYPDRFETRKVYEGDELVGYAATHQTLNGCCMLIPVSALRSAGGFDETLRYAQDALMWLRLFMSGMGLVFDGKVNVGYRLHPSQTSRVRRDLFDKDMATIADQIAVSFFTGKPGAHNAYLYAKRMARYGAHSAIESIAAAAKDAGYPFTLMQRMRLKTGLVYSRFRGILKRFYYRFFLKAKT